MSRSWPRSQSVRMACRNAPASVVAERSLTCPSPSSMSRHVRSSRRARSAVTNGRQSELISGRERDRSRPSGGASPGVSGRVGQPAGSVDPPGARFGRGQPFEPAQDETAGELIVTEFAESGRDLPCRPGVGGVGDVGGLVPVVLHRLDVFAQHCRSRPEMLSGQQELSFSVTLGPLRFRGDRGERAIPARSSCACWYWAALVRSVTPRVARVRTSTA